MKSKEDIEQTASSITQNDHTMWKRVLLCRFTTTRWMAVNAVAVCGRKMGKAEMKRARKTEQNNKCRNKNEKHLCAKFFSSPVWSTSAVMCKTAMLVSEHEYEHEHDREENTEPLVKCIPFINYMHSTKPLFDLTVYTWLFTLSTLSSSLSLSLRHIFFCLQLNNFPNKRI